MKKRFGRRAKRAISMLMGAALIVETINCSAMVVNAADAWFYIKTDGEKTDQEHPSAGLFSGGIEVKDAIDDEVAAAITRKSDTWIQDGESGTGVEEKIDISKAPDATDYADDAKLKAAIDNGSCIFPDLGDAYVDWYVVKLEGDRKLHVDGVLRAKPAPEPTPTVAPAVTPEPTPTVAPAVTPEPTPTVAPAVTPEPTPTVAPAVTPEPTPTVAPAVTPEPTPTVAPTVTPEPTPTVAPAVTPEPTPTVAPAVTPEPTPTVAPAVTPEPTPTVAPAVTPEPTVTPAAEPTPGTVSSPTVAESTTPENNNVEEVNNVPAPAAQAPVPAQTTVNVIPPAVENEEPVVNNEEPVVNNEEPVVNNEQEIVDITDEEVPLNSSVENGVSKNEEQPVVIIEDEEPPFSSGIGHCWIHWLILILTVVYTIYELVRTSKRNKIIRELEADRQSAQV